MEIPKEFLVAVQCLTYNHSAYIRDALDGFSKQEAFFPMAFIIVDDCSTDGNQEVIMQYIKDNCETYENNMSICEETDDYKKIFARNKINNNCFFVVYFLKFNHYQSKKSKRLYLENSVEAKYSAICEGDDYWTDPFKLQKQVNYMESHPECGLVHARAKIYNQDRQCFHGTCGEQNGDFEQVIIKNPIVTLTSCYRTSLLRRYEEERENWNVSGWKMGDYPMWIWMANYSSIHFIDEEVAVYREVEGSATHPRRLDDKIAFLDNTLEIQLFFVDLFKLDDRVKKRIIYNADKRRCVTCINYGDRQKARQYFKRLRIIDKCHIQLWAFYHSFQK